MFYPISFVDVKTDALWIEIRTEPGRRNEDNQPCDKGWLGWVDGVTSCAHGAHRTIDSARAAVKAMAVEGEAAVLVDDLGPHKADHFNVAEMWVVQRLRVMSFEESETWGKALIAAEVNAGSTDQDVDAFIEKCENLARDEGLELPMTFRWMVEDHREECGDR